MSVDERLRRGLHEAATTPRVDTDAALVEVERMDTQVKTRRGVLLAVAAVAAGCQEGTAQQVPPSPENGSVAQMYVRGAAGGNVDFYREEVDGHLLLISVGYRRFGQSHHADCQANCHYEGTCLPVYLK